MELTNKVALVTGGSGGLGRAICLGLAAEGAKVAVNYHSNPAPAERLAAHLRESLSVDALSIRADVGQESDVLAMFDQIQAELGNVSVLINNAAYCPTCRFTDVTLAQWEKTMSTNLTGTFLTSREMVRQVSAVGSGGRIVNVASTAAFLGSTTGHSPYDASKGGVVSLTTSLAREFAAQGIAVNCVAPGMIYTDMTAETLKRNEAKYLARIPLQRIADAKEVADVVVFLASSRASYMTGTTVNVSGGMLMR